PFPAAIFKRNTFNLEWREFFGALYHNRIFNYKTFNKWDIYQRLKVFPEAVQFLPKTKLYKNTNDVLELLNRCEDIYIKPIAGKKGLGIYNVSINNGIIQVKTREKGKNLQWTFNKNEELNTFLHERLSKGKYIIQRTV